MIDYDKFLSVCRMLLKEGKPFMAYWHPLGWGRLRMEPYFKVTERGHTTTKNVPKATIAAFRRIPEKARKAGHYPVYFIEYNGEGYKTTGGLEL